MTKLEKKFCHVGPGGVNCNCCFPAQGSKARRKLIKAARKKAGRMVLQEVEDDR